MIASRGSRFRIAKRRSAFILGTRQTAIQGDAVHAEVFTQEKVSPHTIEAGSADSIAVGDDPLSDLETGNVGAEFGDLPVNS